MPNVGGPDQGEGKELRLGSEVGESEENTGRDESVREVIDSRARVSVRQIAKYEGREEEDGEEQPTGVELVVEEGAQDEDCGAFEVEENFWFGEY